MRVLNLAAAAALLTLAVAPPAGAFEELSMAQAQPAALAATPPAAVPAAAELSASGKNNSVKTTKNEKKAKKVNKPKENAEYMRAAPSK